MFKFLASLSNLKFTIAVFVYKMYSCLSYIKSACQYGNQTLRILPKYLSAVSQVEPQVSSGSSTEVDKLYKTVELELKSNDPAVLQSFAKFATLAAKHLDVQSKSWSLRKPKHERFTMYKSVHIYKKHKAQYELRTYFTFVQFNHLTGSTCDTLLEYVQRNLPEGVACKTSKVELQQLPEHLVSN